MKRMEEICKQHTIPHENWLQTLAELTENQKLVTTLREEVAAKDHQMARMNHEAKTKVNCNLSHTSALNQNVLVGYTCSTAIHVRRHVNKSFNF